MNKYECQHLFVRAAECNSFTQVASELNTTQSSVSKKIAWLEKQIGFTLFHRNSRKIQLTEQGGIITLFAKLY